jgi:hypothetical protein
MANQDEINARQDSFHALLDALDSLFLGQDYLLDQKHIPWRIRRKLKTVQAVYEELNKLLEVEGM